MGDGKRKDQTGRSGLDYRTKGLGVVKSFRHSIISFARCLVWKTHLQPTTLDKGGGGTRVQVRFSGRARNSLRMASPHLVNLEVVV